MNLRTLVALLALSALHLTAPAGLGGASPAVAQPLDAPEALALQGWLDTASGQPWQGPAVLTITLWDAEVDGAPLYVETFDEVDVQAGRFALELG